MLIDLRELAGNERFEADVCIVGAGAAGISLARELGAAGRSVVVLESGGFEYEQATQALYDGPESGTLIRPGSKYLASTRLRLFGGTTNHWNGWCRPLDRETFTLRPWVDDVGWPLTREQLDPFYDRAAPLAQISPFDYDDATASQKLRLDNVIETVYFHVSPPTRFGLLYREELERRPRVQVLLHANLRRFETDREARHVTSAEARRLDGAAFTVRARHFVLAAGGIENARLLLANSDVRPEGLGNDHDLVGRYFMDHPHVRVGYLTFPYWDQLVARIYDPVYVESRRNSICGVMRVDSDQQIKRQLLNAVVVLDRLTKTDIRFLDADIARSVTDQLMLGANPPENRGKTYFGWATVHGEQTPNRDSRVTLDDEVDALGMRRAKLDWRLRDRDARNLLATARLLAERLGANGRGRMRFVASEDNLWERTQWSYHHAGTTRMHPDPKRGVVDADCRVHGIDNLYVAGNSVFPTCGSSNPTLTILALALRLSDHLQGRLAN